jgi:hypothetical protein
MARARLRDRHQDSLRRKLQVLKAEQAVTVPAAEENTTPVAETHAQMEPEPKPGTSNEEDQISDNEKYGMRIFLFFIAHKILTSVLNLLSHLKKKYDFYLIDTGYYNFLDRYDDLKFYI